MGIETQNRDDAAIRFAQPFDAFHCGGLSSAVGSDQTKDLALAYLQGNFIDRHGAAICLANSGDSNDWMHVVCGIGQFGGLVIHRLPLTITRFRELTRSGQKTGFPRAETKIKRVTRYGLKISDFSPAFLVRSEPPANGVL